MKHTLLHQLLPLLLVLGLRGLPAGVYSVRCSQLSQRLVVE